MLLSSPESKLVANNDPLSQSSLLAKVIKIYMKLDSWPSLLEIFKFANICKLLIKNGFKFKNHPQSLYHTIGHAMLAAVMCSLRRNCSIDHAYVEYVMLCSFEGVVACSHRTFSRAFAQKHALSKTMYQLSLQVS